MARRRRARCAARLSYGLGALPSRRSHERAAEAARSSVGAGSVRWLSPPQPSRALAGCGVLFSSSLLCLLRSSASGKHAAAAGKPPRATVVDPSPIAATTRTRTIAAGSMRARRVMACGSDVGARAWRSSSASTHSAQHAAARFGRGLATCTPIGPTHGPFHHMCAHRATLSSRGAHARRDRAVDGEVQFASARGAWSSCSAGQLDAAAPRGARRAFGGVSLLAAAARRRAVRDDARCAALE